MKWKRTGDECPIDRLMAALERNEIERLLSLSEDERISEARDLGLDPERIAAAGREAVARILGRIIPADDAASQEDGMLARLKRHLASLGALPEASLAPAGALGQARAERTALRRVDLLDLFDPATLVVAVPWAKPLLFVGRAPSSLDPCHAVYAAYAFVREGAEQRGGAIRVELHGPEGQRSSATLSSQDAATLFTGEDMPVDAVDLALDIELLLDEHDA